MDQFLVSAVDTAIQSRARAGLGQRHRRQSLARKALPAWESREGFTVLSVSQRRAGEGKSVKGRERSLSRSEFHRFLEEMAGKYNAGGKYMVTYHPEYRG